MSLQKFANKMIDKSRGAGRGPGNKNVTTGAKRQAAAGGLPSSGGVTAPLRGPDKGRG